MCIRDSFFRVSKAGCIIQDVDGKIREIPLYFAYKIFFGKIQGSGEDLAFVRVYHGGNNDADSKELFLPNPSEHSLFYVIPAQGNVGFR